jgi:hypothetical protein
LISIELVIGFVEHGLHLIAAEVSGSCKVMGSDACDDIVAVLLHLVPAC